MEAATACSASVIYCGRGCNHETSAMDLKSDLANVAATCRVAPARIVPRMCNSETEPKDIMKLPAPLPQAGLIEPRLLRLPPLLNAELGSGQKRCVLVFRCERRHLWHVDTSRDVRSCGSAARDYV